jgi:hypothetical protein
MDGTRSCDQNKRNRYVIFRMKPLEKKVRLKIVIVFCDLEKRTLKFILTVSYIHVFICSYIVRA